MIYVIVWWNRSRRYFNIIVGFFVSMWHPPDLDAMLEINENQDLIAAYNWAADYAPSRNGSVYEAVLKYAEKYYGEVVDTSDTLDKKADDLMRISGTVAAALAAAGRIESLKVAFGSLYVVIAIVCLVVAMVICALARRPVRKAVPMTIKAAMEVAELSGIPMIPDEDEDSNETNNSILPKLWQPTILVTPTTAQVNATVAASYHWAVTGTQVVIEWKAKLLKRATFMFCASLILIVTGFLLSKK